MDRCRGRSGSTALAGGFVKDDGTGGRNVERANATCHGDAQQVVAGAPDEIVQPRSLAAEDDDKIASEIELVVVGGAAFVESYDPKVVPLEFFEGTDEIDDAGDAQVLGCAGAGFDGGGAERRGAALGEQDAVNSCAIGHAEQRAEVLRIFDPIESEDEASGGAGPRGSKHVFDGEEFLRTDQRDDALVGGSFGGERESLARLLKYAHAGLAALGDEAG